MNFCLVNQITGCHSSPQDAATCFHVEVFQINSLLPKLHLLNSLPCEPHHAVAIHYNKRLPRKNLDQYLYVRQQNCVSEEACCIEAPVICWSLQKINVVGLRWILAVAESLLSPGGIHPRTCHKIYKLPQNQLEIYKLPGYSFSQEGTISMGLQKKTISIENMIFHMIWWNTASCGGPLFS